MSYQQNPLVDAYIAHFDGDIKERLLWLRAAIQTAFPETIEDISYEMPTYRPAPEKRGIIFFAAAKDHIGIYPIFEPRHDPLMQKMTKPYRTGRATLQFKHTEPLPKQTIRKILAYQAGKVV